MKPVFTVVNNVICRLCRHKRQWVVMMSYYGEKKLSEILYVCHECINDMGFELGKAMKPQNFKQD